MEAGVQALTMSYECSSREVARVMSRLIRSFAATRGSFAAACDCAGAWSLTGNANATGSRLGTR